MAPIARSVGAAGCLAVLTAWAASAETVPPASFACNRPGRPDEQIICGDALLRAADGALGRQYAALIADTADPVRREAIRADEHSWIIRRNVECAISASTKLTDSERPLQVDCFLAAYDERAADLDRMKREPGTDPGAISSPIRRSLFAEGTGAAPVPAGHVVHTGLVSADADHPVFEWRADGALLVIGRDAARFVLGLYQWTDGAAPRPVSDAIADAERIDRLCPIGDDIVVIPRPAADSPPLQLVAGGAARLVARGNLPADLVSSCGLSAHRRLVPDDLGHAVLDLGPAERLVAAADDRYVRLRRGGVTQLTTPAIRVDRRVGLRAQYLADTAEFVVSAARRPAQGDSAVERIWAKTNCAPFWRVAAADGAARTDCIPYGSYVGHVPQPLPTKAGLFFAVQDSGLYRVKEGVAAEPVLDGPVENPVVAPDGCRIAFAGNPAADSRLKRGRAVEILDICVSARPRTP
jgi:uncharacterized protein YecT (DUF1311 family)